MTFYDTEKMVKEFETRPIRAFFILLVFIIFCVFLAYLGGFFGEKGKEHAATSKTNTAITAVPKEITLKNGPDDNGVKINQRTYGAQSPATVNRGNQIIEYNSSKGSQKKE